MQADRLNDQKYLNWIRTSLSLLYLKTGLTPFSNEKAKDFHDHVKAIIQQNHQGVAAPTCTRCTHTNVIKTKTPDKTSSTWIVSCSANICNGWLGEVLPYHVHAPCPHVAWANSDPRMWPSDAWEVAKLFQPFGCGSHTKAEDSDCMALLTMIHDCRFFHTYIADMTVVQQIKEVRNETMHSSNLEVEDVKMRANLGLMISLLDEPELKSRPECKEVKANIIQLRDGVLDLTLNKELELQALNHKITEARVEIDGLSAEHQHLQYSLNQISTRQDSSVDECRQLKERVEEVREQISEMTGQLEVVRKTNVPQLEARLDDLVSRIQELEIKNQQDAKELCDRMARFEARIHDIETQKEQADQDSGAIDVKRCQQYLLAFYERHCQRVPIYPLRPSWRIKVEELYVKPHLVLQDPIGKRIRQNTGDCLAEVRIHKIQDIFYSEGKLCKNIFVSADAGKGKTSFCEHLVNLWVRCYNDQKDLQDDEIFMKRFTFLFYVSLREANKTFKQSRRIEDMIASQLGLSSYNLSQLMLDQECLIIMDGLDELTPTTELENTPGGYNSLPRRPYTDKCVCLTTSRPFKLELLSRDLEADSCIERLISIEGLEQSSQTDLANKVVSLLNCKSRSDKSAHTFVQEICRRGLAQFLQTPVLLMQMLGLWYDGKPFGDSQCAIYSNIIEKQIEFAEKVRGLKEEQLRDTACQDQFPACLSDQESCQRYKLVLFKVFKLAYERLFDKNQDNSLVFDHDQTEICGMTDAEVKQLLHMGILTQFKIYGGITEELKSISFLHKSHQEFFCAIYLSGMKGQELSTIFSAVISDLDRAFELEKIFHFLCGLKSIVAALLWGHILDKISLDLRVQGYRQSLELYNSEIIERLQSMIATGVDEAKRNNQPVSGLQLQDIYVSYCCNGAQIDRILACNTQHAKSVYMYSPLGVVSWPRSSCIEKIYLSTVNTTLWDFNPDNFSTCQLSVIYLNGVQMAHEQINCLCATLSSSCNLRQVYIDSLACTTHRNTADHNCTLQLDLSRNKSLEMLWLWKVSVGEVTRVRLNREMDNLRSVSMGGLCVPMKELEELNNTLPGEGEKIELGNMSYPVVLKAVHPATSTTLPVLERLRRSPHTRILEDCVKCYGNIYEVWSFSFVYKRIPSYKRK